ncbi:MAG: hybrid sensor histidine kinase/response regulator, partial [Bacteroides sp.]|nr:hybrid sensor histidine kinase/response regulator [Bacteroides sp.]
MICGLATDQQGNIWISTHQGVSKLLVNEEKFINYYANDGLQGNEFTQGAVCQDNSGRIYFGGINGITSFYPHKIIDSRKELHVTITEFYLDNEPVRKGDRSGGFPITDRAIMDATLFTLAHNENTFSIEFSVLEYNNPERITYQYKIEEIGDEWINTHPGINQVTFSKLKPGNYTFHVRAKDHDNFSEIRTLTIRVAPPWYETGWAYTLWCLTRLFLLYLITMFVRSRILHKQELVERLHQEQISEAKLQFFINISHEIRTPITLIID